MIQHERAVPVHRLEDGTQRIAAMGDRTYARLSIPARHLVELDVRAVVAEIIGYPRAEIEQALAGTPAEDEAAYDDGISLRLVSSVPCLVVEDFQANYGAASEEESLVRAKVPYVLIHSDGGEYSAGSAAFDGKRRSEVQLNREEDIVVSVDEDPRRPRVRPGLLATVRRYLSIKRTVLAP